jgi:hypothetical protein
MHIDIEANLLVRSPLNTSRSTRPKEGYVKKGLVVLLPILGATFVFSSAYAAQFFTNGSECVQNFTATPEIKYDNSATATAVNSSASIRDHFCGVTSNSDKVLTSITVRVVDRSAVGAVECSAFNGSFTVGPAASAGSDASIKSLPLNITDATWGQSAVRCNVPAFAGGLGSGVRSTEWITN